MNRYAPFEMLDAVSGPVLTTSARLIFAGTLLVYYVHSGLQKFGDGITGLVNPGFGAYGAIWPRAFEAAGYDLGNLGFIHWAVAVAGTWAEIILPVLIVLGLFTRLAALGMIGFIFVQSWVDIFGHNIGADDLGGWFDRFPGALILDQRAYWVFLLAVLFFKGAGPLSLDRVFFWNRDQDMSAARTASVQPR